LATFFYLGKSPKAPGTVGTLGALLFVPLLMLMQPLLQMLFILSFVAVAIFVSEIYQRQTGAKDPSEVVIDEVAGFWVAICLVPVTWKILVVAFILFRFLDILKPFPIGYIDKKVSGGAGIVLDDVVAGLIVNIFLHTMIYYFGGASL